MMEKPNENIKTWIGSRGVTQQDLVDIFKSSSRVSDMLSGKRKLSSSQIKKLHFIVGIPLDLLIVNDL